METATQAETVEKQQQPFCDACREYRCNIFWLSGKYQGTYLSDAGMEVVGNLCILHFRSLTKDEAEFRKTLADKKLAEDFNFRGVWFSCDVAFRGGIKDADFRGANFGGKADFSYATFSGGVEFVGATFGDEVSFCHATFSGMADFSAAIFCNEARFRSARFIGDADFGSTNFAQHVDFSYATFNEALAFYDAAFSNFVTFSSTTFRGFADFQAVTFANGVDFRAASFQDAAIFLLLRRAVDEEKLLLDERVRLDFCNVQLLNPERVYFGVDMEEVSLLATDVRNVDFAPSVRWPEKLRDEREAKKHLYPDVEKVYRQLRQNYEDQRNYPDAGRFYYGEMEMRRKAHPWWGFADLLHGIYRGIPEAGKGPVGLVKRVYRPRSGHSRFQEIRESLGSLYQSGRRAVQAIAEWFLNFVTGIYCLLSGYGQRPLRAGVAMVSLFVLFVWLYTVEGLRKEKDWWTVTHSLDAALLHAAEVLTFTRERTYKAANDFGRWLSVAQTILLPLQVALLVLAVRRAFRR